MSKSKSKTSKRTSTGTEKLAVNASCFTTQPCTTNATLTENCKRNWNVWRAGKLEQIAIFLCDKTGNMALPWSEAGYTCYCVDVQHSIRKERISGNIHYQWGDVRSWIPPRGKRIVFVACFTPCTDLAVSGARDFKTKGLPLLCDGLTLFGHCIQLAEWSGAPWMAENPTGVISTHYRKPDFTFDPCDYGDPYTKQTHLWTGGGFVMPERTPVAPSLGSMMHRMPPSKDRANKRSATPMGFARAVFKANYSAQQRVVV